MTAKRLFIIMLIELALLAVVMFGCNDNCYAGHIHSKTVTVTSAVERNGYVDVKWKKDKSCKAYCVHIDCGSKALYSHCVGKTQSHYRIKITKTLEKKMNKCGNWKVRVYCSDKKYHAGGSGSG